MIKIENVETYGWEAAVEEELEGDQEKTVAATFAGENKIYDATAYIGTPTRGG